jgi:hypothetical protein
METKMNLDEVESRANARIVSRQEALELVMVCAQDIVDAWPKLTFRTIGSMSNRIDTLRQALGATRR